MDAVDRCHFERKLREYRRTLEQQLCNAEDDLNEPEPGPLDKLWRRAVLAQAREIDRALRKIQEGAFGTCEQCRKKISRSRLDAVPWAQKCFACHSNPSLTGTGCFPYGTASSPWYSLC